MSALYYPNPAPRWTPRDPKSYVRRRTEQLIRQEHRDPKQAYAIANSEARRRMGVAEENPLSPQAKVGAALLGIAAVFGGIAYWLAGPAAAQSPAPPAAPASIVLSPGPQTEVLTSGGASISLPTGATWVTPTQDAGTGKAIAIPALTPGFPHGQSSPPITVTWYDAAGVLQTTVLTLVTP